MAQYYQANEKVNWLELPKAYTTNWKNQPGYKWYKPILALLLTTVFFLIIACTITTIFSIALTAQYGALDADALTAEATNPENPLAMAMLFLVLASFIPSLWLGLKLTGLGGLGTASSIEGKLRWDRIKVFAPLTVLAIFAILVLESVANGLIFGWDSLGTIRFLPITMIMVIILVPLQSAGEEYLCRSAVMQALGSWIPVVIIPVILQAVFFGCLHAGQYDITGVLGCLFMGLCAGYIAVKTGGIEGGIVLHASNNTLLFLQTCIFNTAAIQYSYPITDMIASFAVDIIGTLIILHLAKKHSMILKKERETRVARVEGDGTFKIIDDPHREQEAYERDLRAGLIPEERHKKH